MRRNLQNKFNVLGAVLILFAFLLVPMFNQVKADTRGSLKEAKNTWMNKMFREVAKDFKPRQGADTDVEDYWAEQVKQNNEDCRQDPNNAKCNANGDLDGDGMTNGDEVRAGRNPSCNEEKMTPEYCKDADKFNVTGEDPRPTKVERIELLNSTWRLAQCGTTTQVSGSCPNKQFMIPSNTTQLEVYLNVTRFTGTQWNARVSGPGWNQYSDSGNLGTGGGTVERPGRTFQDPPAGDYNASLQLSGTTDGEWDIRVWAIVVS